MSTSRHIDKICIVLTILALIVTVLFINGEKLGLVSVSNKDSMFTDEDKETTVDVSNGTHIVLKDTEAEIIGNGAYFSGGCLSIAYPGVYVLEGSLQNGYVNVEAESGDKIWIVLSSVEINSTSTPAIRVEKAGKVFINLAAGTENTVSSGAEYENAKEDGAIWSRADLTFNGEGSLTVRSDYKHGIVCNDDLIFTGGKTDITAKQDGIHANDSVRICGSDITVNAGDDGITASNDDDSSFIYVESGNISIPSCYEGIEAVTVEICGGNIDIRPSDDGINANGNGSSLIGIKGGNIKIINEDGRDADGLDSNGDIDISGGSVFISVSSSGGNCAVDYGSENGGEFRINGGRVAVFGSSLMFENVSSKSEQAFIVKTDGNYEKNTRVTVKTAEGENIADETVPCGFSALILSFPEFTKGDSYVLSIGDTDETVKADNTSSSQKGGMNRGITGENRPEMPTGQQGQPPEMPTGQQGQPPEMPTGQQGQPPEMPTGQQGQPPEMPTGQQEQPPEMPTGQQEQPPEMPTGQQEQASEEVSATDGNSRRKKENTGGFGDRDGFSAKENRRKNTGGQDVPESIKETLLTVLIVLGVSAAVLILGIIVAVKKKYR